MYLNVQESQSVNASLCFFAGLREGQREKESEREREREREREQSRLTFEDHVRVFLEEVVVQSSGVQQNLVLGELDGAIPPHTLK